MRKFLFIAFILYSAIIYGQDIKAYKMGFENIIEIDSSKYVLIPMKWLDNATFGQLKINGANQCQNIIFYNPETNDYRQLFEDSMQIITGLINFNSYYQDIEKKPICINNKYLLFTVKNHDYNQDNIIGNKDPLYLYYCKTDGTLVTRLTPQNYHVLDYKFIKMTNVILVTLVEDNNKDNVYNNQDKQVIYKIDLNNLSKSEIVFELKIKKNIE